MDFTRRIREALTTCSVVLVVIGPRWIDASRDDGTRRLDDPHDYLRMEITAALQRDSVLVIPVLVAGASMPTSEQLPEPLQPLAFRQAVELSDPRWSFDVARLSEVIRRALARRPEPTPPEAQEAPDGGSSGGRRPPTGGRPGDADGHGDDTSRERPSSRIGAAILAVVLVVLLAGGGTLWWNVRRTGGGQTPSASASTDPAVASATTPSPSEPSADATEASEPSEPAAEPEIAFVRDGELWGMDDGGDNARPFLSERALEVRHPDWSSDGRVAFASADDIGGDPDGDLEIWTMDEDGTNLTQVTDNEVDDSAPDWSPDASRIAYSGGADETRRDIFVIDSEGRGEPANLTDSPEDDDTPDWSPDGRWIVWETEIADGTHDIHRMSPTGTSRRPVTNTPGVEDFWPAWSPDGATVAFRSNLDGTGRGRYDIYTVQIGGPADAAGYRRLTRDMLRNHQPAWSPEGDRIAFVKDRTNGGGSDLYTVSVDDGETDRLTGSKHTDAGPVWRPQG